MHFAIAFDAALKSHRLSQAEASAGCGLHQTALSRYLRGDLPKGASLAQILAIFAGDKAQRRQLIYAYVRDILEEAKISPDEVSLKSTGNATLADNVDSELYTALSAIGCSAKHNQATRDMVLQMALVVAAPTKGETPTGRKMAPCADSSAHTHTAARATGLSAHAEPPSPPRSSRSTRAAPPCER